VSEEENKEPVGVRDMMASPGEKLYKSVAPVIIPQEELMEQLQTEVEEANGEKAKMS